MDIATSSDSTAALKAINAMKKDRIDALVTVAMAYEGLSIDAISHIICLTRVRSVPWIEQMVARANRIDRQLSYRGQMGHIFAPADLFFKDIVKCIEQEQIPILTEQGGKQEKRSSERNIEDGFCLTASPGGVTALSSAVTGQRQVVLDDQESSLFDGFADAQETILMTNSERERGLRNAIKRHIGEYSFNNRMSPKQINYELFERFGKPREQMTLLELEAVFTHVKSKYALSHIRGAGHPRVPAKATPYQCAWR